MEKEVSLTVVICAMSFGKSTIIKITDYYSSRSELSKILKKYKGFG